MSRIANQPISIPDQVVVKVEQSTVTIQGPKGKIKLVLNPEITVVVEENTAVVKSESKSSTGKQLQTTTRTLIANAIVGVTKGWKKVLELVGVGYRATVSGDELTLRVGYSHPVKITAPTGISFTVERNTITVTGINKQRVGETAAFIRRVQPAEPYKGKGIRYQGEEIRRKAGKAAKAVGASFIGS